MIPDPEILINYWFYEIGPDRWFEYNQAMDEIIREKFEPFYNDAVQGLYKKWEETPEGILALMLLFDCFPRRMFAGTPKAYATDEDALELARTSIIKHFDDRIDKGFKLLIYLPFSHSEHLSDQRLSIFYIRERTKEEAWVDAAERRFNIIQRFGRFPHRNAILGRVSTPEETVFLKSTPSLPLI